MRLFASIFSVLPVASLLSLFFTSAAGAGSPTLTLADFSHYVFVPNRSSADVAVIDTRTDALVTKLDVGRVPHQVAVSPERGKIIASNTEDHTLSIITVRDSGPLATATLRLGHTPEHMEISPGGDLLAVGNIGDGTVSLVSLDDNSEVARIEGLYEPHNMTFNADGSLIYVGNLGADFVSVIDVETATVIDELMVGDPRALAARQEDGESQGIINVTRTPDGRLGFAAFGDGDAMAVFDLESREKLATLPLGDSPWRAYTTEDGRHMLVPNNGDRTVSIFSTQAPFAEVARLPGAHDMTGVNTGWFDSVAFVIGRGSDEIAILDLETMSYAGSIDVPGGSPETGVTTPDGKKLYVALSGDSAVAVIDTRTRTLTKTITDVGEEPWGAHMVGALNYCH